MKRFAIGLLSLCAWGRFFGPAALATGPGSMDITCDVDRTAFRLAAKSDTQVTFRLWNGETGGVQCGPDYVVQMADLVALRVRTDSFDDQRPRKFAELRAAIGSDANPVQLCSGAETWLDVSVGLQTLTCDFSSTAPKARRRLQSVPFSQSAEGGGVTQVSTGSGLQGGPIISTGTVSVNAPTCSGTDKLTWNGSSFQCAADQTGASGTVTSVGSGAGLLGGPITTTGSLSVNAPTCTGTDKLTWNGSTFQCEPDQNSGGTMIQVDTGAGLSGGPISTTGTISVNAPTCTGTDKLTWTGLAFQCATDETGPISAGAFGGNGSDGALAINSGITTLDLGGAPVFLRNHSSISITGTGGLSFSNPHPSGTIIILKSQGNLTITSANLPAIDISGMGSTGTGTGTFAAPVAGNGPSGNGCFCGACTQAASTSGVGVPTSSSIYGKGRVVWVGAAGGGNGGGWGGCVAGRGGGGMYVEVAGDLNISSVFWAKGMPGGGYIPGGGCSTIGGGGGGGSFTGGSPGSGSSFGGCGGGGGGMFTFLYNGTVFNSAAFDVSGGAGGPAAGTGGTGTYLVQKNTEF